MLVRHFMTKNVVSLRSNRTCREALRFLRDNGLRRAPVIEEGALIGMVSERDLLRILPGTVPQIETQAGADAELLPVARVMATKVVTVDPEEHLEDASRKMLTHKIGGIPVVLDGEVVGIITESDIFRAMARVLDPAGVLRISIARTPRGDIPPDPVRMAMIRGFEVRGFLTHDRPGGETLMVLRLVGDRAADLIEAYGAAGYNVLEILDARQGRANRTVA